MAAPLAGVRVLELARILAGPWAGQVLADLGAEVVKVESPAGDDTRHWGPPFIANADGTQDAAYFHVANRGKTSQVLDFSTPEGQATVRELAVGVDVVIENFKVGGLAKYGLDYGALSMLNPRLVYCSITGFGQTGPYAARAGYDVVIQAMGGIMDITGDPDGAPQKIGVAYADILTGLYAVIGIQAALRHRETTGRGQLVDVALFDVMVGTLANQAMNALVGGQSPPRLGNVHPNIAPYEAFAAKDGWFVLAVGNDAQFQRLWALLDLPPDPELTTNEQRIAHRRRLSRTIAEAVRRWDRSSLLAELERLGVPAGPINNVLQALHDPQIKARGMILDMPRVGTAPTKGLRLPIHFSEAELAPPRPAPPLNRQGCEPGS